MLMPAIRAIYFSPEWTARRTSMALAKKRAIINENSLKINSLAPAGRIGSALPLFVAGIRANDVNNAATPHDFTVLADLLYRRTYFHFLLPMPRKLAFFIRPSYWCDIMCEVAWAAKSMTPTTMMSRDVPPN